VQPALIPLVLSLALVVLAARAGGYLAARVGQPAVLGELLTGLLVGNLELAGYSGLQHLETETSVDLLAQAGVAVLLFQVGLESTVGQMKRVGVFSVRVAVCGVAGSFAAGWIASRLFLPSATAYAHIFLGATLIATSVGVSARMLKELGRMAQPEARVILGAAVVDDVIGLAALAVMGASIALSLSRLAGVTIMLAAFVAGLMIDERRSMAVARVIDPLAAWLVPAFFLVMGLRADLSLFAEPGVVVLASALVVAAVAGKLCCAAGLLGARAAGINRLAVSVGMLPRGEVELVFANLGLTLVVAGQPVISPGTFAAIVVTVMATTLVTPPALTWSFARIRAS
jgi:Na+:H+ antiporter